MSFGSSEVIQVVITVVMIILIIFGNVMLCVIIFIVRTLRCPSGFLLVNLAISDILVGVLLLPFSLPAVLYGKWTAGTSACVFNGFLQHVLSAVSVLTVLSVSIDRYLAILTPLKYKARVTTRKTFIAIGAIWFYALFSGCYPLMQWTSYVFIPGLWLCENNYLYSLSFTYFKLMILYVLPFLAIVYIYGNILKVSWHHSRQIRLEVESYHRRQQCTVPQSPSLDTVKPIDAHGEYCLRKPHSLVKTEIKSALALASVVGLVFLSWAPYLIVNLWAYHTRQKTSVTLLALTSKLYYLSSVINPYLYGYLNRNIKREFKKMVLSSCARLGSKRVQPTGIT